MQEGQSKLKTKQKTNRKTKQKAKQKTKEKRRGSNGEKDVERKTRLKRVLLMKLGSHVTGTTRTYLNPSQSPLTTLHPQRFCRTRKPLMKTPHLDDILAPGLAQPGGVVVKHSGLWTRRREFESLPGYFRSDVNSHFFQFEFREFL